MILKGFDDEEIIEALSVSTSSVKRWRTKPKNTNDLQALVRKDGTGSYYNGLGKPGARIRWIRRRSDTGGHSWRESVGHLRPNLRRR